MDKTKISNLAKKCAKVIKHASEQYGSKVLLGAMAYGAFKVGETYEGWCIARGLYRFHAAGIVKLFDFEGNEISIEECNKLIAEHFEELRKIPIKR